MISIGFCEKLFSNVDDFREIEVIPGECSIVYSWISCAQATAEFYDDSVWMVLQKRGTVAIKLFCSQNEGNIEFFPKFSSCFSMCKGLM